MQADKTVAELLCQRYLRLNGYFTMPNFIAHDYPAPVTEVDVPGVRFCHSHELDFADDGNTLAFPSTRVDIVFTEAAAGRCKLNGPWKEAGQNLEYVLRRVGAFADDVSSSRAATELARNGRFQSEGITVRVLCFGSKKDKKLAHVTQILWPDVIAFIHNRFNDHKVEKAEHQHWDDFGQYLWDVLRQPNLPSVRALADGWKKRLRKPQEPECTSQF